MRINVGIVLIALTVGSLAQTSTINEKETISEATKQPSMDVGAVSLSLGMPHDRVLAQIKQAGYNVLA